MNYIKVELKRPKETKELLGLIRNDIINVTLNDLKDITLKNNKDLICETHRENSKGTVLLSLNSKDESCLELVDFCCESFKSQIQL